MAGWGEKTEEEKEGERKETKEVKERTVLSSLQNQAWVWGHEWHLFLSPF